MESEECLRSSNSSNHVSRETLLRRESATSNSFEKVILGVDTNRKGVQGIGEELLRVLEQRINHRETKIPVETEYFLPQRQNPFAK